MRDNRNEDNGLVLKCNYYNNCIYDIALTLGGEIAQHQGNALSQSIPAGNRFTHNCAALDDKDFYAQLSSGHIFYWTHNDIPPSCFTSSLITPSLTDITILVMKRSLLLLQLVWICFYLVELWSVFSI